MEVGLQQLKMLAQGSSSSRLLLSQVQTAFGTQKEWKNTVCPNWFLVWSFQLEYESALFTFQKANPKLVYGISAVNHLMVFEAFSWELASAGCFLIFYFTQ